MNDIEDSLRAAFDAEASRITEESLRPTEPPSSVTEQPASGRWSEARGARWVGPGVAAAAVVAVTIGVSVLHDSSAEQGPPAVGPTKTVPGPTTTRNVDSGVPLPENGRTYDVVSVIGTATPEFGGSEQLYLHRWKVLGHSDAQVAAHGIPIVAHTDFAYSDMSEQIYVAPLAKDAHFIVNECTSISSLSHHEVSAEQFLDGQSLHAVILRFDPDGRIVEVQTDGGC